MSLKLGLRNSMRRGRVTGADFTGLLDESFATGATAAYSLRRLKSSATQAVRVREDGSNTEADIGFSGPFLDETALLNHCGSANGFVTKWYDQSGNGNDASNSTASEQPQIVSSGSVIQENGNPAISGNRGQQLTGQLDTTIATQPFEIFGVIQYDDTSNFNVAISSFDSSAKRILQFAAGDELRIFAGTILANIFTDNSQILHGGLYDGSNSQLFLNGSQVANGDAGSDDTKGITLMNQNPKRRGNPFFKGKLQEVIIYDSDKSSNRTNIETNINNFYSIT